ncbi:MAG: hypothetical protein JWM11_619, partial [Planctomycetaceae bacterium]|nr:hypothetical protein [Planctomycetaceae bacterium]
MTSLNGIPQTANVFTCRTVFTLAVIGWSLNPILVTAQPEDAEVSTFEQARKLQDAGKLHEAFLKYLQEPGGEYAAVALARPQAREFLELLKTNWVKIPTIRAMLVKGDLQLVLRNKVDALACYRDIPRSIAVSNRVGWEDDRLPRDAYFVEPAIRQPDPYGGWQGPNSPLTRVEPFTIGPGSHRDNWLLRRFIALEAWPEAHQEFERVWQLHREAAGPEVPGQTITESPSDAQSNLVGTPRTLVVSRTGNELTDDRPSAPFLPEGMTASFATKVQSPGAQFNGLGLQFALDYAFFLERRKDPTSARRVLLEPLLLIDLDHNLAFSRQASDQAGESETTSVLKPGERRALTILRSMNNSAGVSPKEYIRLAFGAFKTAGKEAELVESLEGRIRAGENRLRRVLAQVRLHQGRSDEALALEMAFIDAAKFDPLTAEFRRGVIFEEFQKISEATLAFEKSLTLPFAPPKLPDPEVESPGIEQVARPARQFDRRLNAESIRQEEFHQQIMNRLLRLYVAQGQTEKILATTLRQFELSPQLLEHFSVLTAAAERFRTCGQEPRFNEWARQRLLESKAP